MPLVINRDSASGDKVVDRTTELVDIPNNVGVMPALNLFQDVYSSQKRIEVVRTTKGNHIAVDRNWDERNSTIAGRERDSLLLKIPHFPLDDAITPNDIDGTVQVDSIAEALELETVANVRADKMIDLRLAHGLTLENARMQLITTGTVYAPTGTLRTSYGPTVNFYTEFGVTRTELPFDFTGATDPRGPLEAARRASVAGIRNGQAGALRGFVALCSSTFFDALYTNAYVTDAVKYFQQPISVPLLTARPDANFGDARFREVTLWGITFIDVGMGGYDAPGTGTFVPYIPEGDAYLMPLGVRDMFKTYYAPANKFATINRQAQGSYWFEYANEKDDIIEIMTEQNFLNACLYPQAIVRLYLD